MVHTDKIKNIAIFGATGHIAKNLIYEFSKHTKHKLFLFSRDKTKVKKFVAAMCIDKNINYNDYENIHLGSFDVIINCVGISNPLEITKHGKEILILSEKYDEIIIEYIKKNTACQYLNFSSGVIYGDFSQPVSDESFSNISLNDSSNAYTLAKIRSETKHRLLSSFNIIDIRMFSFFSRFIDLNTSFFISEIITSINNNKEFLTNTQNFFRDFIHPDDLFQLICLCIEKPKSNFALDAYSKSPISKYDILKEFNNHFNLKYFFNDDLKIKQPTGFKEKYYSVSRKAKNIGYLPTYSSLETILSESQFLIIK
ncbi:MAG: NAD(P)-dependent oxidoreductase [Nitrosarchaeum sp.]|nr:NAD(P)-dependent oxidoreductase [Nitrosarchaeum sp.]